jgi:hypothetical protein
MATVAIEAEELQVIFIEQPVRQEAIEVLKRVLGLVAIQLVEGRVWVVPVVEGVEVPPVAAVHLVLLPVLVLVLPELVVVLPEVLVVLSAPLGVVEDLVGLADVSEAGVIRSPVLAGVLLRVVPQREVLVGPLNPSGGGRVLQTQSLVVVQWGLLFLLRVVFLTVLALILPVPPVLVLLILTLPVLILASLLSLQVLLVEVLGAASGSLMGLFVQVGSGGGPRLKVPVVQLTGVLTLLLLLKIFLIFRHY